MFHAGQILKKGVGVMQRDCDFSRECVKSSNFLL